MSFTRILGLTCAVVVLASACSNGGTITRAESFIGGVSGTTVAMKVSRSFQFARTYPNATGLLFNHVDGYPTVSVRTTLTKQ